MEVEVEGKTTEDAIENACKKLNQPRERLEITIITPGSTGIFGIVGTRKARVRARVKGSAAAPGAQESDTTTTTAAAATPQEGVSGEGGRRPSRGRRRRRGGGKGAAAAPPAEAADEAALPEVREEAALPVAAEHAAAPPMVPEGAPAGLPVAGREFEPDFDRPEAGEPAEAHGPAHPAAELPPASEELVAAAREACEHITRALGFESIEVRSESLPGEARLELLGEDCSALIGSRGEVLNALQHLVSKIANRQSGTSTAVTIDAEGWRDHRRQALEEMALKLARKAKQSGKPVSMSPMNAQDRRVVHLVLQQDGELVTKSRGDGALRKVVIFPRRGRRGRKPAGNNDNHSQES